MVRGTEIPTIDVNLVTVQTYAVGADEIILDTASQIAVDVQTDTVDSVKLVIKGVLKAQKPEVVTVTGNQITLTDNVFTPELVKILQGGTITYDTSTPPKITGYQPPVAGSGEKGALFRLRAYSAQYDASGQIVQYECIEYPNCQGVPIGFGAEDGVFRVNEYTINSAPNTGEPPYTISYVSSLPSVS